MDIVDIASENGQRARKILEEGGIISAWESIGAKVNIIGSARSGLMIKKLDIDLHVYSKRLDIAESFSVMGKLAAELPLDEVAYRNLIDTEEECVEWHALYRDKKGDSWKLDMIHIRSGSKYDGTVERVTDALMRVLTPETRRTILEIKSEVPYSEIVPGIDIYRAVISGGVKRYADLEGWLAANPMENTLDWLP